MRELFEAGDAVDFKRSSGLAPWMPGTVVDRDGDVYTVEVGSSRFAGIPAKRVRAPRNARPAPRRAVPPPPPAATLEPRSASVVRQSVEAIQKAAPFRSAAWLSFVREFPCAVCAAPGPSQAHHFGPRGMGEKCDDCRTVPLCRSCHEHFHHTGRVALRGQKLSRDATEALLYRAETDVFTAWMKREALLDARRWA